MTQCKVHKNYMKLQPLRQAGVTEKASISFTLDILSTSTLRTSFSNILRMANPHPGVKVYSPNWILYSTLFTVFILKCVHKALMLIRHWQGKVAILLLDLKVYLRDKPQQAKWFFFFLQGISQVPDLISPPLQISNVLMKAMCVFKFRGLNPFLSL